MILEASGITWHIPPPPDCVLLAQVSFGVHKSEAEAARQYDRALIIVKGRLAKTNFPVADYDAEVAAYINELQARCAPMRSAGRYCAAHCWSPLKYQNFAESALQSIAQSFQFRKHTRSTEFTSKVSHGRKTQS